MDQYIGSRENDGLHMAKINKSQCAIIHDQSYQGSLIPVGLNDGYCNHINVCLIVPAELY